MIAEKWPLTNWAFRRTILISPRAVRCLRITTWMSAISRPHMGEPPRVVMAVKRSRPDSIVLSYQGDGDLSAIGSCRFCMRPIAARSTTVVFEQCNLRHDRRTDDRQPRRDNRARHRRLAANPRKMSRPARRAELLATREAPVHIERVALGDNKQIAGANRAVYRVPSSRLGDLANRSAVAVPYDLEKESGGCAALDRRGDDEDSSARCFRDKTKEATSVPAPSTAAETIPE